MAAAFSRALFLEDGGAAHVLGGPGDDGDMLVPELAAGESLLCLGQLLELPGDADPLGRRATGEPAHRAEPLHQGNGAMRLVLAGLVEAPEGLGEGRLFADDHLPDLDHRLAQRGPTEACQPGMEIANRSLSASNGSVRPAG